MLSSFLFNFQLLFFIETSEYSFYSYLDAGLRCSFSLQSQALRVQ